MSPEPMYELPPRPEKPGVMDANVLQIIANLDRHVSSVITNTDNICYVLVCPAFGDEPVARYRDFPPAKPSTNDILEVRISDGKRRLGEVYDYGLDAVFEQPRELKNCDIRDPYKIWERYMFVITRINLLYVEHFHGGKRGRNREHAPPRRRPRNRPVHRPAEAPSSPAPPPKQAR
jgi:hypothetical protein